MRIEGKDGEIVGPVRLVLSHLDALELLEALEAYEQSEPRDAEWDASLGDLTVVIEPWSM